VIVTETNGLVNGPVNDEVTFKLTLTCTVTQFFKIEKSLTYIDFTILPSLTSPADIYEMPVYGTDPAYCQLYDIESSVVSENTGIVNTDFIKIDNSVKPARLIVQENDP